MKSLFTRKPLDKILKESLGDGSEATLHRTLGPWNLTSLGVGAIIGAGIFVLTGQAAAQYAGPAIVLSFVVSSIACALAGLCYAELASMLPISGSAYTYAYATLGELIAWVIGWDLILEYLFGAATVAVGWSGYVVSFLKDLGIEIPARFTAAAGTPLVSLPDMGWTTVTSDLISRLSAKGIDIASLPHDTAFMNLPAMFIVFAVTILLVIGIKESANFNNIIVFVKVGVVLLFIGAGLFFIQKENWTPFIPENGGSFGEFGWSGIFRGAAVIFFAYIGFDAVSTTAQEAKNPQRDLPIGILGSLAICTVLYILVAAVLTGMVKYTQLLVPDPIAVGVNAAGSSLMWLRPFVKIGAVAGLSSVVLVMLMAQPRIFYAMSKDGLLPRAFSKIHRRFKTPYIPTILTGLVAMVTAGLFPIGILGELVSIGTLLAFTIVCAGVLVLRRTHPEAPRAFKTPWSPWVPLLGVIVALLEMASLPLDTWIRLIVWMAIGFVIYFAYGRKHSHFGRSQRKSS